jgi:hypothetical protein
MWCQTVPSYFSDFNFKNFFQDICNFSMSYKATVFYSHIKQAINYFCMRALQNEKKKTLRHKFKCRWLLTIYGLVIFV